MNIMYTRMLILRMKRSGKMLLGTFIATFLAVFFISALLLFQENLFEWQMAANKERFGNWFLMEANTSKQSEYLMNNEYLSGYGTAYSAEKLYDEWYRSNKSYVGYLTEDFIRIGCIELVEGRMPESDNEIVMDRNTLAKHGIINPVVGQNVTLRYYEEGKTSEETRRSEEYILVGILEDYSNVWQDSRYLPGALVTQSRYDKFNHTSLSTHIYGLSDELKHKDYKAIYEDISKAAHLNPVYNSYVYDCEVWDGEGVYSYMYILVMVIGILAIAYQLFFYRVQREKSNNILRQLGATRSQIVRGTMLEQLFVLAAAGILGIIVAVAAGSLVCGLIERGGTVKFYYVSVKMMLKSLFAIVMSVIMVELVAVIEAIKDLIRSQPLAKHSKRNNTAEIHDDIDWSKAESMCQYEDKPVIHKKSRLNKYNVYRTIGRRFIRSNKLILNIGIRMISLTVCVIITLCGMQIYDYYNEYMDNRDNTDIFGVVSGNTNIYHVLPIFLDNSDEKCIAGYTEKFRQRDYEGLDDYIVQPDESVIKELIEQTDPSIKGVTWNDKLIKMCSIPVLGEKFTKLPDTNITLGVPQSIKEALESIAGIDNISYNISENQRIWTWDGMSMTKLGLNRHTQNKPDNIASSVPYRDRYLFATEYVSASEDIYDRLCRYIEEDMQDYEAWSSGEQVVVFINDNPYGEYDDTIKAGTDIKYHYYSETLWRMANDEIKEDDAVFSYDYPYTAFTRGSIWSYDIIDYYEDKSHVTRTDYKTADSVKVAYNQATYMPAVSTKAAVVIVLTDEIKEEFRDIIIMDSQYMAVASSDLAQKLCDAQNELLAKEAGITVSELPEDCKAKVNCNSLSITYDVTASVSSTDNIVRNYFKENNIAYTSYYEENERYRTNLINAVLRYGITIVAAMVINILIYIVIAGNRTEARAERVMLLKRIGAAKGKLVEIFMTETLREALWCVYTLPIILVVQLMIYRKRL